MVASVFEPEIASAYGALDEEAFALGQRTSAYVLRKLATNANYLLTQSQQSFSLLWPMIEPFPRKPGWELGGSIQWTPCMPELWLPKKPGLDMLDLYLTAGLNGEVVYLQASTSRTGDPRLAVPSDVHVGAITDIGDPADFEILGIAVDPDPPFFALQLYSRGDPAAGIPNGGQPFGPELPALNRASFSENSLEVQADPISLESTGGTCSGDDVEYAVPEGHGLAVGNRVTIQVTEAIRITEPLTSVDATEIHLTSTEVAEGSLAATTIQTAQDATWIVTSGSGSSFAEDRCYIDWRNEYDARLVAPRTIISVDDWNRLRFDPPLSRAELLIARQATAYWGIRPISTARLYGLTGVLRRST